MEIQNISQHSSVVQKTPDFIKRLLAEDSGLGMDFDDVHNSPMCLYSTDDKSKRKRQNNTDTPVSFSMKKCLKLQKQIS